MNPFLSRFIFYYPVTIAKGEMVLRYYKQYKKFENLNKKSIDKYKYEKMKDIISFAYLNSNFYRELYDSYGLSPSDFNKLEDIKKFPKITKQDIVNNAEEIKTKYANSIICSKKTTGGSTGRAVTIYKNPDALARERAATAVCYNWAGISLGDPQARFWGVPLHKIDQKKYKIIDFLANRIRFSAFSISQSNFENFYIRINQLRPRYLYGYSSVLNEFVDFLDKNGKLLPNSIKAVISTSEVLTQTVREKIENVTRLKVFNEYGCGEVGSIAHECEAGKLHIVEQNILVEIDSISIDKTDGNIIVTDFFNKAMPLIRYQVGDYGEIDSSTCTCGRKLSVLSNIYGREYDILETQSGEKVHPEYVMYLFEEIKNELSGLKQFQVEQKSRDSLKVRLVKDIDFSKEALERIRTRLKEKFGNDVSIDTEFVTNIQREPSGKLRLVKNLIANGNA